MSNAPSKPSYKDTLNLPKTDFAMEAKLVQNEPKRLARWREMGLYQRLMAARADAPLWVLHDGPPFANGEIHIGHLLNKTLKDVILRFRSMQGLRCPYVPGWDCHGLPIEQKIQDELGSKMRQMSATEIRAKCFAHARKYLDLQAEQFQRLGVLGEWGDPYFTMAPKYEAGTLEVFARYVEAGLVYRKLKPVHWSIANQTALADADVEYQDIEGPSIYVEFPAARELAGVFGATVEEELCLLVWTTTPWTLPANLAVAVHADVVYELVSYEREGKRRAGVVAAALREQVLAAGGATGAKVLGTATGAALAAAGAGYRHPFIDRRGPIVTAAYVTTTDGTGLVHTAPGHGEDDYHTGLTHKLDIYCPVLPNGRFDDTAPEFIRGMKVFDADKVIIERLKADGHLLASGRIVHSYPHDDRSKTPTIFRAAEQWFIDVDKPFMLASQGDGAPRSLRQRALDAVSREVRFHPRWGQARIEGMLQSRPDWCISRQRPWGLPIPLFYNEQRQPLLSPEAVRAVARTFAAHGSDAWYTMTPAELLGEGFACPPGFSAETMVKENDIFDVWLESGSSWLSVLVERAGLHHPCELYLEGSDQHRGWFQLSMLNSLAVTGRPPFKEVLTHGFIVGPDGRKVSKRDPNYVTATQEIERHGADVLRLYCCSVDCQQGDVPASPGLIKEFADKYRKIRNTLRYLLSNLSGFDPAAAAPEVPEDSLDGWMLHELDELIAEATAGYEAYQLHRVFKLLHEFCAVQISSLYGNAMKDRLYCERPDSPLRRRCQWVMHRMADALIRLLAPMCVYTADEAWEHLPRAGTDAALESVHLALLPTATGRAVSAGARERWALLMRLREEALMQLDRMKKDAGLNKPLDAEIQWHLPAAEASAFAAYGADLEDIVGAGYHSVHVADAAAVKVVDRRNDWASCARSWKRRPDVGADADHADLSARDAAAVRAVRRSDGTTD